MSEFVQVNAPPDTYIQNRKRCQVFPKRIFFSFYILFSFLYIIFFLIHFFSFYTLFSFFFIHYFHFLFYTLFCFSLFQLDENVTYSCPGIKVGQDGKRTWTATCKESNQLCNCILTAGVPALSASRHKLSWVRLFGQLS